MVASLQTPLVQSILQFHLEHEHDSEALGILGELAPEPETHRRYTQHHA